jgi:hypothetical protein
MTDEEAIEKFRHLDDGWLMEFETCWWAFYGDEPPASCKTTAAPKRFKMRSGSFGLPMTCTVCPASTAASCSIRRINRTSVPSGFSQSALPRGSQPCLGGLIGNGDGGREQILDRTTHSTRLSKHFAGASMALALWV